MDVLGKGSRLPQIFYTLRGGLDEEAADEFCRVARRLDTNGHRHEPVRGRLLVAQAWFRCRFSRFGPAEGSARGALELLGPATEGHR